MQRKCGEKIKKQMNILALIILLWGKVANEEGYAKPEGK
jgi:hypothetical protein